jgi:hypothetical protein
MRIQNVDGSGWTVVIAVDDDSHLTVCASHENRSPPADITDDVFDWEEEFGVRLSAQQEVTA